MSYQFKKLSEVELLDAVPEGAKVLAEVDGEFRRVPSNGLGSAGAGTLPEFDLTAMGLPALTLDGNPVSVECDTTELEAALEKNVVKISCTLDVGMGVTWPITGIVNAFRCNGGYQCGFVANLDGLLFWCLDIYDGTITGRIIPLATT